MMRAVDRYHGSYMLSGRIASHWSEVRPFKSRDHNLHKQTIII